jgi:hypothetical protein
VRNHGNDWDDSTQPLDIVHGPDPLPQKHEREVWLARLLRAMERPTLNMKPVRP